MRLRSPRAWALLALSALLLNLVWEVAQSGLYAGEPPAWVYVRATVSDMALIAAAAAAATVVELRWPRAFWPVLVVGLLVIAATIELRALAQGRWSYGEAMPTVATIGVAPLVQLPLLGAISAWLGRCAERSFRGRWSG